MKKLLLVLIACFAYYAASAQAQKQVQLNKPDTTGQASQRKQQDAQYKAQLAAQQTMTLDTATLRKHHARPTNAQERADSLRWEIYLVNMRQKKMQDQQQAMQKIHQEELAKDPTRDQRNAAGGVVPQRESYDKQQKTKVKKPRP